MKFPFFTKLCRRKNARFRNRSGGSRLAVNVPMSRKEMRLRRQARTRTLVRRGGIALGVLALGLYARSLWKQSFHGNPDFRVGRFEFHSNGGIAAQQAATAAGLRTGMNLMEVDLSGVRTRLLALPRVKEVNVERRLPDRIAIELTERLPVAWITSAANGIDQKSRLFVDRDGVAFKCEELLREYMALPVIDAADQPVITLGQPVDAAPILAALALLEQMRTREWSVPCSVERIEIPNAWTLVAGMESGSEFTFHPDKLAKQMERLEFILARTHTAGKSVRTVNLQMQRNVPVTFYDTVADAGRPAVQPGVAVPLTEPLDVSYSAPAKSGRATPAPAARLKPAPGARQEHDIQTILRGI